MYINLEKNDLLAGGEGAPISPIYHKLMIETLKLSLPAIVLNIGGITNLSYWDGKIFMDLILVQEII